MPLNSEQKATEKKEDPDLEDDLTRILRDAYWNTLGEYVRLDDLNFPKDQKTLITVLELECGEALEAGTLCAYLKRGKHRSEEINGVLYFGIDSHQEMIKAARERYKKVNPIQKPFAFTKKFNFNPRLPNNLAETNALVLNHLDPRNKESYTAWKDMIEEGVEILREGGIIICTLELTE